MSAAVLISDLRVNYPFHAKLYPQMSIYVNFKPVQLLFTQHVHVCKTVQYSAIFPESNNSHLPYLGHKIFPKSCQHLKDIIAPDSPEVDYILEKSQK